MSIWVNHNQQEQDGIWFFPPDRNEILRSFYVLFQHFYGKLFTQFFKTFNKHDQWSKLDHWIKYTESWWFVYKDEIVMWLGVEWIRSLARQNFFFKDDKS